MVVIKQIYGIDLCLGQGISVGQRSGAQVFSRFGVWNAINLETVSEITFLEIYYFCCGRLGYLRKGKSRQVVIFRVQTAF